ncbi:MAG: heme exporter protein CcmB [Bacteroidota bacterium]
MWKELRALLYKELLLEWKQKYALNGLVLYVLSMVVVVSLALVGKLNLATWNILYWIMILFIAINAVAKSFMAEKIGHLRYLYPLARPASIILAKLMYNTLLLILVAGLSLLAFAFLNTVELKHPLELGGILLAGCTALSANLTLVTAIAAQAENRTTLLAVLGFPLVVPTLLVMIRLSQVALEGLDGSLQWGRLSVVLAMAGVLTVLSVILFPFIWRE